MDELKPCPFCGGEAELKYTSWWDSEEPPEKHDVWSVGCAKRPTHENCCLGRLCMSRGVKDRDKAIEAWNTRATDAENAELRELVGGLMCCPVYQDDCAKCKHVKVVPKEETGNWPCYVCTLCERAKELGIEVDG